VEPLNLLNILLVTHCYILDGETGEPRSPSYRNISTLFEQRRAYAVSFCI